MSKCHSWTVLDAVKGEEERQHSQGFGGVGSVMPHVKRWPVLVPEVLRSMISSQLMWVEGKVFTVESLDSIKFIWINYENIGFEENTAVY